MKFSSALRSASRRRIESLVHADIIVGIPCYNNQETVGYVVETVQKGLNKYYRDLKSIVMVSDGGSVDDSREMVEHITPNAWNEILIGIYRGIPGKGCALRAIFEAGQFLKVKACLLFDSDLRSITPEWVKRMAEPILSGKFDYVSPCYKRYKYDGTITNFVVYPATRALYGQQIRQPIGGDFSVSPSLIEDYLKQDIWETDVGKFGVDIWMTTNAIVKGFRIAEARLGVKIHDVKDPTESLGPMFRQVVDTLFELIEEFEPFWKRTKGSEPIKILGKEIEVEPKSFNINLEILVQNFKIGFEHFGPLWQSVLEPENYNEINKLTNSKPDSFVMDTELWVKLLYNFAAVFHAWKKNRFKLVTSITPLYNGMVASFANRTKDMDYVQSEELIQKDAEKFEEMKDYLVNLWE